MILYYIILYYIILYYIILYFCFIKYNIILYYITLYYIILYYIIYTSYNRYCEYVSVYSTRAALDSAPHPLPIWLTSVSQQLLLRSAMEWSRFQFQWGWEKCPNELLPPWHCTGWSKLLLLLPPFVFLRLPEFKETPPMTLSSRVFTMCAPPSMLCPKSIRRLGLIGVSCWAGHCTSLHPQGLAD